MPVPIDLERPGRMRNLISHGEPRQSRWASGQTGDDPKIDPHGEGQRSGAPALQALARLAKSCAGHVRTGRVSWRADIERQHHTVEPLSDPLAQRVIRPDEYPPGVGRVADALDEARTRQLVEVAQRCRLRCAA